METRPGRRKPLDPKPPVAANFANGSASNGPGETPAPKIEKVLRKMNDRLDELEERIQTLESKQE